MQVRQEHEGSKPSLAKLKAGPAKARALVIATHRVDAAAAALAQCTGAELTLGGLRYPGPGRLQTGQLAEFCEGVMETVAAMLAAKEESAKARLKAR